MTTTSTSDDFETYIQYLVIDGTKCLINGNPKYAFSIPRNAGVKLIAALTISACADHGINYIADDTVQRCVRDALSSQAYRRRIEGKNKQDKTVSVKDAIRVNESLVLAVQGIVVSVSEPYKMISELKVVCTKCETVISANKFTPPVSETDDFIYGKCPTCRTESLHGLPRYVNAKSIQLQDQEPEDDLERLTCILFEEDAAHIITGELVEIPGEVSIVRNKKRGKHFSMVYAHSLKYINRQQLAVTQQDEKAIKRFASIPPCTCGKWTFMDRLIAMVGPDVLGHELAKEAILYVAVGYPAKKRRGRIHALFVGDPGEAKSTLMRAAIKLVPNSRYVTAQNSTGKSLMAIIDSENEVKILRQGSVPLAKNAICGINEIGTMSFEDQKYLLDAMEEGFFAVDKWGMHVDIDCPTSIIATTNQIGAIWKEADKIDNNEIPLLRQLIDRFDLIIAFRRKRGEKENREYADKKSKIEEKHIDYNYSFLRKYLHHARSLNPSMSDEARAMLNEYWVRLAEKGFDSRRLHEAIFNVAKARACLHLKEVVEPEDANGAMEYFNKLIAQYKENVPVVSDPRDIALEEIIKVVQESPFPVEFSEAARVVSERHPHIARYLGKDLSVERNKKLRNIRDLILQRPDARLDIISKKPLTMVRSDRSDRSVVPTDGGRESNGV